MMIEQDVLDSNPPRYTPATALPIPLAEKSESDRRNPLDIRVV